MQKEYGKLSTRHFANPVTIYANIFLLLTPAVSIIILQIDPILPSIFYTPFFKRRILYFGALTLFIASQITL